MPPHSTSMWKRVGIAALVVLIASVLGVNFVILNNGSGKVKAGKEKETAEAPPPQTEEQKLAERLAELVKKFTEARSINDKLALVRTPQRAEARMSRFYSDNGLEAPVPIIQPRTLERETIFGRPFVRMTGIQNRMPIPVYFEDKGGGEFKIDWESMVGYTDSNWKSFVVNQPLETFSFRVMMVPGDYYNYKFADPTVYRCVKLLDLKDSAHCFGYAERDSAIGRKLDEILPEGSMEAVSCRVEIRFEEPGKDRRQVKIEKLEPGWLKE